MGGVKMKSHYLDTFLVHQDYPAKGHLGGDKSAKNLQALEHEHLFELETEEVVIEDLLKPLLFTIKYTLPFHNTVEYDPVMRCCVFVKGSFWRKIGCIVWELLIVFRLGIAALPNMNSADFLAPPAEDKAGISMVAQIANVVFLVFGLATFYVFWFKAKGICDVLNSTLQLVSKIHLNDASAPRSNWMKYVTHASWMFVVCYVMMTLIMHTFQAFSLTQNSAMLEVLKTNMTGDVWRYRLDFTGYKLTNEPAIFKAFMILANFMNIAWWMLAHFHSGIWALFFGQLVQLFFWRIQAKHDLGQHIVISQEIRIYNQISTVIDKFNQIYGLVILFGTVVVVTYVFLTVKHVFTGIEHLFEMSSGLHLCISYIPIIVGPTLLAELPRIGGMFAATIKVEFGNFTKESGDPAESLCGIAIVHHDLTTSNFGFKGLGFFTVSYQFITTAVGVIISYTILMAQLLPKENGTKKFNI